VIATTVTNIAALPLILPGAISSAFENWTLAGSNWMDNAVMADMRTPSMQEEE